MPHCRNAGRASLHEDGYAMAALLVAMTIMAIFMSMALPAWRTAAQREKEAELIFRGQQYARAIALFQRKYANTFPPNLNVLLDGHFLRKKYKDPMTQDGEFQLVYANQQASAQPNAGGIVPTQGQPAPRTTTVGGGASSIGAQGGLIGVASKSTATSLRVYNGHDKLQRMGVRGTAGERARRSAKRITDAHRRHQSAGRPTRRARRPGPARTRRPREPPPRPGSGTRARHSGTGAIRSRRLRWRRPRTVRITARPSPHRARRVEPV